MIGEIVVRLVVLPAQLLSLVAGAMLMTAPFLLAWQGLARLRHGAWPHASVGDLLGWAHVGAPPGAQFVPLWLALGVVGYLGLLASTALARALLRAAAAMIAPPALRPPGP